MDRYEILGTLGRGGCGVVYSARHVHLEREVALKLLHRPLIHSQERMERFFREARVAAAVGNPHIVRVSDCGVSAEGIPFLAMELLEGVGLEVLLEDDQALPVERALGITLQILDGLQAAHDTGVVHRDLKPENILLTRSPLDDRDFVKLVDFGVSKVLKDPREAKQLTGTGVLLGTPRYMAPEQFQGARSVDHRADLFAVAVVLYQMLSGILPFKGHSPLELAHRASTEAPRPLSQYAPHVPAALISVVEQGLAKNPDERFANAASFAQALRAVWDGAPAPTTPAPTTSAGGTLAGMPPPQPSPTEEEPRSTIPTSEPLLFDDDEDQTEQSAVELPPARPEVVDSGAAPWQDEDGTERSSAWVEGPALRDGSLTPPPVSTPPSPVSTSPSPVSTSPPSFASPASVAPSTPPLSFSSSSAAVAPVASSDGLSRRWTLIIVVAGALSLLLGLVIGFFVFTASWLDGDEGASRGAVDAEVSLVEGGVERAAVEAVVERSEVAACCQPGQSHRLVFEGHVAPPGFGSQRLTQFRPRPEMRVPSRVVQCCADAFRAAIPPGWNPGASGIFTLELELSACSEGNRFAPLPQAR